MANIYDKQIKSMQRLINYGVNENTDNGKSIVEYHAEGADGKTYGIIRECNKFYIKVAPKKDTALLAEDYDYIGGFNNRKSNEYSSYNVASKQFELKMKSLNEAYQNNQKSTYQFKPVETAEWQINETKEMRAEINRFNDIMYNVNGILSEDKNFTTKHTLPEAPASNPSDKKVNGPFTDTAVAKGDKDFKQTKTNYAKAGAPFNQDGTVSDSDMQSTKNPKSKNNGNIYTEKPKYVETGVASQKPSGAKSVKMNEDKKVVKVTDEQVLAWNKDKNYLDRSKGTKIGSTAPYGEISESEDVFFNTDNQNSPAVGCGEIGDKAPYKVNEDYDDYEDIPFPEVEDDEECLEPFGFEDDELEFDIDAMGDEEFEYDFDDETFEDYDDETDLYLESKVYNMVKEAFEMDEFGKHPAYDKTPMTTPFNVEIELNGARDWNDDSVKSDQPFGKKIGDSAPYSEKVVDMITDMIYNRLNGKKKV